MATTPQQPPPKHDDKDAKAPAPEAGDEKKPAELSPDAAFALFHNGERIAKVGDPPEKWITQGMANDGTPVVESPMSDDVEKQIRSGKFYKVE